MIVSLKEGVLMDGYESLNSILVNLFNDILSIEEKALITGEFTDITVKDMHIIEAIGVMAPKTMSEVARALSVTMGTLTIGVNGLVKKGYAERTRSEVDRRIVYASLTTKGKAAYLHHMKFHREMINSVMNSVSEEEAQILTKALNNLEQFFMEVKNKQN